MELWIRRWDGRFVFGGFKIFYSGDKVEKFGSDFVQFEYYEFYLEENERIVKVEIRFGWMIDSLIFYFNKRDIDGSLKIYGFYGGDGGSNSLEILLGLFGYLLGVVVVIVDLQGEEGIIRFQFVWRIYVFFGDIELE